MKIKKVTKGVVSAILITGMIVIIAGLGMCKFASMDHSCNIANFVLNRIGMGYLLFGALAWGSIIFVASHWLEAEDRQPARS